MKPTVLKTDENLTLREMIDDLILASRIEGKSEKTIEQYKRVLYPFAKFVKCNPHDVKAADIREYLASQKAKGLAEGTIWTCYKNLSVLFNFCIAESYMGHNPMDTINKPRVPKILPKVLKEEEVQALLKAAKTKGFLGKRNVALIALMFDSGLRASEICGLRIDDVSLENQVVKIFGKGSKERIIPFSRTTAKLLFKYLRVRRNLPFEDAFFVTISGTGFERHTLYRIVKRLAQQAGIKSAKVSPHVLRHSFATSWIKAGGDAKRLQHMLGRSDSRIVDIRSFISKGFEGSSSRVHH